MKIICPECKRVTELEHVSHGCSVECVCSHEFKVDDSSIVEEYSEIDSIIPEQIGQYRITEFIGYGGMGKLYKGIHPNLGIPVALKALRMEYVTDTASCDRFIKSAKICAKLNHPNIVRVYDCGYDKDNVYLVMEYISGGSAQDLLEREGALEQHRAAQIAHDVCLGLMAAEYHGIVHRDIKPENIMFADDGTVKVLDMGLAKISGDPRISSYAQTISFTSLGTEQYMPPEQAIDASSCDSRADVYSLGITLYQLCTGKLPFDSTNPQELRRMHALQEPQPPRELKPELHTDLEYIILKCIRKNRDDRYQSIDELELDLDAFLKNHILPSKLVYERKTPMPAACRFANIKWRYAFVFLAAASLFSVSTLYCLFRYYNSRKQADAKAKTVLRLKDRQQRSQIRQIFSTLAPMLLEGKFDMACEYYNLRAGRELLPGLENVFSSLRDVPYIFARQWKQRIGQTVTVAFRKAPGTPLTLLVNDVIGNTVYATDTQTRQAYTFIIHDLTPEDQKNDLRGINPIALSIWIGCGYASCGRRKDAETIFQSLDLLGEYLIQEMYKEQSPARHRKTNAAQEEESSPAREPSGRKSLEKNRERA